MTKQDILKFSNPIMFISFLIQLFTIIIIKTGYIIDVSLLHEINGYILSGLILFHLYLNFGWIINQLKKKK